MAYMSPKAVDLVLSREAMTSLGLVNEIDDSTAASVHLYHLVAVAPAAAAPVMAAPAIQAAVIDSTRG